MRRPPRIHHCTSEPFRFFGRGAELALLDEALRSKDTSLVAFDGPGGQGKTAIVQHWLDRLAAAGADVEGVFLWSFYRGKDADLCLRELYAYAEGLLKAPQVSASFCVDQVLATLRRERWAVVLDGTEVVQYESGSWFGRFIHPELGRFVETIGMEPLPGVVVLTTRFLMPELEHRRHARVVSLACLDQASTSQLLLSLGVRGSESDLAEAAAAGAYHAKAVELLGTYLARFCEGDARAHRLLPLAPPLEGASDEEQKITRVLAALQAALSQEAEDIVALVTAFRDPPTEDRLVEYLASASVRGLLHTSWGRTYLPFTQRPPDWLLGQIEALVGLRLLERVGAGTIGDTSATGHNVIDAHPIVRRAFGHFLGTPQSRQSACARAGFLRGRPDRRRPSTLAEAREEIELFYAHCDAGLWNEADSTFVALENPKHRFLAPALERDLLLRFFPDRDWRRPPLWSGFGRYRSLAISLELLGQFEEALEIYREADGPLRGDCLLALGRLGPLLETERVSHPWNALWLAYRAHALCLAGRTNEAVALACSLVPIDVYEWIHVFECLLRAHRLDAVDLSSLLSRPPFVEEQRWSTLARERMRGDYLRIRGQATEDLHGVFVDLLEAYDRGGLPQERVLVRLSHARYLLQKGAQAEAQSVTDRALQLARQYQMPILEADAWGLAAELADDGGQIGLRTDASEHVLRIRKATGYLAALRP